MKNEHRKDNTSHWQRVASMAMRVILEAKLQGVGKVGSEERVSVDCDELASAAYDVADAMYREDQRRREDRLSERRPPGQHAKPG